MSGGPDSQFGGIAQFVGRLTRDFLLASFVVVAILIVLISLGDPEPLLIDGGSGW